MPPRKIHQQTPFKDDPVASKSALLIVKKKTKKQQKQCKRISWLAMNEWKNIHRTLYKADTPRLWSTAQNICFLISIIAVTGQNHIHFWLIQVLKNSMTWYFLTFRSLSSKLEFVDLFISPVILRSRREYAHLLVNPIPKLTIVLILKTPACLKFGKTSNRAAKNLPQRKFWVWAANDALSHKNLITPNFGERVASSETIDLRTLEFGLASTRCPSILRVSEWLICIS